jgi:hypothetical protein
VFNKQTELPKFSRMVGVDEIEGNEFNLNLPLWKEIEIIGRLYQFYISEKKDQVIGNVVKSEDIPAATQLFTPKRDNNRHY